MYIIYIVQSLYTIGKTNKAELYILFAAEAIGIWIRGPYLIPSSEAAGSF